jgi:hypothetical protein
MAMNDTNEGQEAMLRLWTPKRIAEAFAKVARPDGTVGEEEIMFVIQGIIEEYEFTHEQDEAARQQDKATIAQLEADLEAVTQDAMTQNNEVVRLTALVEEAGELVPDGKYDAQHRGEFIEIDRDYLTVTAYDIVDDSNGIVTTVGLPEGWQLRRRKESSDEHAG